jgi:hypothetical protein
MNFALLETVVLNRDLPAHGLRAGDLGAVVVTLKTSDLRTVAASDILSVRAS